MGKQGRCLGIVLILVGLVWGDSPRTVPIRVVRPGSPLAWIEAPVTPGMAPRKPGSEDRPHPLNLATALSLAGVNPLDIALAQQRVEVAAAQLKRTQVLWLPSINLGIDYYRHDGQIQDVGGVVFGTSKSTFFTGFGPTAVFAVTDALFAPLAAKQEVAARSAALQAVRNDSLLSVAEAFFNVQQARGELIGALDAAARAEDVARRTLKLSPGLVPEVEVTRTRVEAARRQQLVQSARERWRIASAELARLLRLPPASLVEPLEPPQLQVTLVSPNCPVDELIALALTNRPELAAQQAFVQATLNRLRQEKLRPLLPSVLVRGSATTPGGTLATGYFGGGRNSHLGDFSWRSDYDVQLLWEWQNLGLGNLARVNERRAEREIALVELLRVQDRIAAEVVQAQAQVQSAAARLGEADAALKDAVESANKNLAGLGQTQGGAARLVLVIRPQEVIAAIQALGQAYSDYYGAVADFDRAQFRLYRALGHPAEALACSVENNSP